MNNYPLVSVIVPVYNVENYLKNCIESVICQTYNNWELILVDDGSPDNSGAICDDYSRSDDRIKVIHKQNGGQAQARNYGLDICRGDYIAFLDSDDFLHNDCINYLVNLIKRSNADLVQCGFVRGEQTVFPDLNQILQEQVFDNHSIFLREKARIIVWGKLYKREIVLANRIKEGKYFEDDFTTWKWYYHAHKIVVSNKVLYYYTDNPSSTMAQHHKKPSFDFLEAYDERISFFQQTGEKDLEHCSRLQLCKTLVLTYKHQMLTREERSRIKLLFDDNWKELKYSPDVRLVYKMLFFVFSFMTKTASEMAAKIRYR